MSISNEAYETQQADILEDEAKHPDYDDGCTIDDEEGEE